MGTKRWNNYSGKPNDFGGWGFADDQGQLPTLQVGLESGSTLLRTIGWCRMTDYGQYANPYVEPDPVFLGIQQFRTSTGIGGAVNFNDPDAYDWVHWEMMNFTLETYFDGSTEVQVRHAFASFDSQAERKTVEDSPYLTMAWGRITGMDYSSQFRLLETVVFVKQLWDLA